MNRPTEVIPLYLSDGTWTDGYDLSFCARRFSMFWGIPDGVTDVNMSLAFRPEDGLRRLVVVKPDDDPGGWDTILLETQPGRGDEVRFEVYTETWEWLDDIGTCYVGCDWSELSLVKVEDAHVPSK
jgi:hypothetical protein